MTTPSQLREGGRLGPALVANLQVQVIHEDGNLNLIFSTPGAEPEAQVPIAFTDYPEIADDIWSQLEAQAKSIAEQGWC